MASKSETQSEWLNRLLELESAVDREALFRNEPRFHDDQLFPLIHAELIRYLYSDKAKAFRSGEIAEMASKILTDDASQGIYQRCKGNLFFADSKHPEAVAAYENAVSLFDRAGRHDEAGRVYFGGMQPLIYLGRYDQAHAWAQEARLRFEKSGDKMRLARLDLNIGNLCYRQDRYEEAMRYYTLAREGLALSPQPQDFAAVLSNSAVCLTSMGLFSEALSCYQHAQQWCSKHQLAPLSAAAGYNLAYLHYLRSEYRLATDLYHQSRIASEKSGDEYHRALCDLDESEMMLELNMSLQSQFLAQRAAQEFLRMKMPYEHGKALAYLSLARFQRGNSVKALRILANALSIFKKEKNRFWVGMVSLYGAIIYEHSRDWNKARFLAERAKEVLAGYQQTGKTAVCNLLLAKLALRESRFSRCRILLEEAREAALSPGLKCHISYLQGTLLKELGENAKANHYFSEALATVEKTRHEFWTQELKISYLQDKARIYEAFTGLLLNSGDADAAYRSFGLVQRAKSRTLLESLDVRGSGEGSQPLIEATRNLNAHYIQIDAAASSRAGEGAKGPDLDVIRERIQSSEETVAMLWQERTIGAPEAVSLWEEIAKTLPEDCTLIEFFIVDNTIHAWLLNTEGLTHHLCGQAEPAYESLQLLQFQFARMALNDRHATRAKADIGRAIQMHLGELYEALISPIRASLRGSRLIIAPNSFLTHVPYSALGTGAAKRMLDDFVISTIPSAGVYYKCRQGSQESGSGSLIVAAPDDATPFIAEEAKSLAALLPESEVLMGESATVQALLEKAGSRKYLHIAAHGLQRRDNPLFSAIQLGDSKLRLIDLERLQLRASLVTLSGCSTGVGVVKGGDELLGLTSGFLNAGARAMLATLWDVNDEATAKFMVAFYGNLLSTPARTPAAALQATMRESRDSNIDVYTWGAFQLAGIG
jgi:CHAT domain-containing protein/predicted negative regulator of RcsB-dependent stress response